MWCVVKCVFVRARVCVCGARACACMRPCTSAFVSAHVRVFVHLHRIALSRGCVFYVCVYRTCVRAAALCAPSGSRGTAATCGIYSAARDALCGRTRAVAVRCHRPGSRASAAGVNWTCRTANAGWGDGDGVGRGWHTSVVDAAGAIYVIGGNRGGDFDDVWASTDGGARPDSV
jgi:hypothetical protein